MPFIKIDASTAGTFNERYAIESKCRKSFDHLGKKELTTHWVGIAT
jgi:hypothetical protein